MLGLRDPPPLTALELAGALSLRRAHFSHSHSLLSRLRLETISRRFAYILSTFPASWYMEFIVQFFALLLKTIL